MAARIYTRTGDAGETSLGDGIRIPKDSLRVRAYGGVDETSAWVGTARAFTDDPLLQRTLEFLQHRLYCCASALAVAPGSPAPVPAPGKEDIAFLERAVDRFEESTGKLTTFVLPGGGRVAGLLHAARAVCRRAERNIVTLAEPEPVDPGILRFMNRASDFLFAAARYANHVEGKPDVHWDREFPAPEL